MQEKSNGRISETQLVVRLPLAMRERLEAVAARNERNVAQELRRAVRLHVEAEEAIDTAGVAK